jgi:hypothetical protein
MLDCQRKKLLLSPGGAMGQNVTGKQLTGLNSSRGNQLRMRKAYSVHASCI